MTPANRSAHINEIWGIVGLMLAIIDYDFYPLFSSINHAPMLVFLFCAVLPDCAPRILSGYALGLSFFWGHSSMMHPKQSCLLSFVIGSMLTTHWIAKYTCNTDLYTVGSGNLGASGLRQLEVSRVVVGVARFFEMLKGIAAIQLQGTIGLAWCILGHIMSPWSSTGRGGQGSLVLLGGLLFQSPGAGLIAMFVYFTLDAYGWIRRESQCGWLCRSTQSNWFNIMCGITIAIPALIAVGKMSLLHVLCIMMVLFAHIDYRHACA
jgi:glycerol-3-phosphate acyltransferase PlsY